MLLARQKLPDCSGSINAQACETVLVLVEEGSNHVTVENGGAVEKVLLGETFSADLATGLAQITSTLAGLGFAGLAADLIATLTAGGYLSSTLKAE